MISLANKHCLKTMLECFLFLHNFVIIAQIA